MLFRLSAQYCVRQGASAYLELWAFLLLLAGAAILTRRFSRVSSGVLTLLAVLTGGVGASIFYGCSMTAAADQGLGWFGDRAWYTPLHCLGQNALGNATGWCLIVATCLGAILLLRLGIIRRKPSARVMAFAGSAVLLVFAFAQGFFFTFGWSWCTSSRLF